MNFSALSPSVKDKIFVSFPLLVGLFVLYIPTFYDLFTGIWTTEAYAHGPIILLLSFWLIYQRSSATIWSAFQSSDTTRLLGYAGFAWSLLLYIVGRSQNILIFEMSSFVLILISLILISLGWAFLKLLWFPFFFMLFMIPLPGSIVATLTLPMKMAVSYVTESILFWANYPIARSGVVLQMGPYQLLVADACAGLQTLLTLEALGLFYLNVVKHTSPFRNVMLAILIIPISFASNVIRVLALTLITYYFGDAAGQGFLHGFAGLVLFITALILIMSLDSLLQSIAKMRTKVSIGGAQ